MLLVAPLVFILLPPIERTTSGSWGLGQALLLILGALARVELTLAQALQGRELVYGYPEELASQIADRMALSGAGRVPILERGTGRVLGIVGRKDLFRSRARRLREESERAAFLRRAPSSGA